VGLCQLDLSQNELKIMLDELHDWGGKGSVKGSKSMVQITSHSGGALTLVGVAVVINVHFPMLW
jgi:hypothetical protein